MIMDEQCKYDPRELTGQPIGMFHCPSCGDMVLAGLPHPPPDVEPNEPQSEREFFCYWLAKAYVAGRRVPLTRHREIDEVLREVNQVLAFAGYEPDDDSREELLAKKCTWTFYPVEIEDGQPVQHFPDLRGIAEAAREMVWESQNWENYQDCKGTNSAALPPEWFELCARVEDEFGAPPIDDTE